MSFLDIIKDKLIVSCQALENEPLHGSHIMRKMAKAAQEGGAVAIRANSYDDIVAIKEETNLPVIGLIKKDYEGYDVYITPTVDEINTLIKSGCEVIAMDATNRPYPDNVSLKDKVDLIHKAGLLAMADISTYEEAIYAAEIGFDIVSTTLSGYTPYSKKLVGPDVELVARLVKDLKIPVIAEGRINTIEDLLMIKEQKPFSVVVGSAITRPQLIAKRFVDAYNNK
ncbi:N-acetylmannosamine-6-phosphate 2-epimerase [Acholeplasma hippikon]|uniref:Putative N-acetylmannosamine-6-phosphate 2-epimerase n=1 Tax=Acholeplasma hippikon TaxID=264636 RepID=A0A449BIE5_9MOLU|nr:N-acetylmannosamine-6-phosphate 2-epimerase [Acholeplasma hippikon]VEU82210.1 N-acetylmannosamine-6-phosphate 2-epimerase [Acholeplasma hippikon]